MSVPVKWGAWTQSLEYGRWRILAPVLPSVFTDALAVHCELLMPPGGSLVNKAVNKSLKCSGNAALSPTFTWLLVHQFTTACFVTVTDKANCNSRVACMCRETKKLEKGVPVRCRRRYAVGAGVSGSQQHLINRTPRLCFILKDFLFTASIYFLLL